MNRRSRIWESMRDSRRSMVAIDSRSQCIGRCFLHWRWRRFSHRCPSLSFVFLSFFFRQAPAESHNSSFSCWLTPIVSVHLSLSLFIVFGYSKVCYRLDFLFDCKQATGVFFLHFFSSRFESGRPDWEIYKKLTSFWFLVLSRVGFDVHRCADSWTSMW